MPARIARLHSSARAAARVAVCLSFLLVAHARAADDAPFSVQTIQSTGRTVFAELADVDGDGRTDVVQGITIGMPPTEERKVRVYAQAEDGTVPSSPTIEVAIPTQTAGYDVGDVAPGGGAEVVLLRPRGVDLLAFARDDAGALVARTTALQLPSQRTIGVTSDERGLDWLGMIDRRLGPDPVLVVPGLSETFLLSPSGELLAALESGSRANYFLEPRGFMLSESQIQIFLDAPRISVGDVNGDGRVDVVAATRHEVLVFLRREDGGFAPAPSQRIALGRVSFEDHIRGSGAVRTMGRDIDGDGLLDLLISEALGGVMNANSDTYVYFNRGSGWNLSAPDYAFASRSVLGADQLSDVDGDGRLELLRVQIPISVLELIEILLTTSFDANLYVYGLERRPDGKVSSDPPPWFEVKFGVPFDFDTSRTAGFIPTVDHDFNGDGFLDYISSTDGTRLEVFVGEPGRGWRKRSGEQKVSTEGQLHTGDLNGDGLTDGVIFNSRRSDEPLEVLVNLGRLPGTRAGMRAQ